RQKRDHRGCSVTTPVVPLLAGGPMAPPTALPGPDRALRVVLAVPGAGGRLLDHAGPALLAGAGLPRFLSGCGAARFAGAAPGPRFLAHGPGQAFFRARLGVGFLSGPGGSPEARAQIGLCRWHGANVLAGAGAELRGGLGSTGDARAGRRAGFLSRGIG